MSTIESVLEHHLTAFAAPDVDEIMADYTDDSVVVTNMGTFRGLAEIQGLFENLAAEFSQEGATIDMHEQLVEGDFAYIIWQAESPDNVYEFATDTFYVPEETILFQTFAGKVTPKA